MLVTFRVKGRVCVTRVLYRQPKFPVVASVFLSLLTKLTKRWGDPSPENELEERNRWTYHSEIFQKRNKNQTYEIKGTHENKQLKDGTERRTATIVCIYIYTMKQTNKQKQKKLTHI